MGWGTFDDLTPLFDKMHKCAYNSAHGIRGDPEKATSTLKSTASFLQTRNSLSDEQALTMEIRP
jgi:hypothetical protein